MSKVRNSHPRQRWLLAPALVALACLAAAVRVAPTRGAHTRAAPPPTAAAPASDRQLRARAEEVYGRLPQVFEANRGQTDARVEFISRGHGYSLFLTATEAVLALDKSSPDDDAEQAATISGRGRAPKAAKPTPDDDSRQPAAAHAILKSRKIRRGMAEGRKQAVLRLRLLNANDSPAVEGFDELPGRSNYFIGDDEARWLTNVPQFAGVRYREVYAGVDLVYRGHDGRLEYDFHISPGADPRAIALDFEGADGTEVDAASGDLVLRLDGEEVRQQRPFIYQETGGARVAVSGGYELQGGGRVGFRVGQFDPSLPLVIDPVLTYSTYLGGGGGDSGFGVAVDDAGSAYLTGHTASLDFPARNAVRATLNGTRSDVFVSKLNPQGTALVYSTYVGGSVGDVGHGIGVDSAGNAYVCGATGGSAAFNNFPVTNAFDATYNGTDDAFLFKLNPAGSALVYSTYLGGGNTDLAYEVAVEKTSGEAYLSGITLSSDFPTTPGALKTSPSFADVSDAFVTKINAQGNALAYSTLLGGGWGAEAAYDIALDSAGHAYVTGETASLFFPVTPGAFQTACAGCVFFRADAFVSKLNPQGTALVYSTYLGGSLDDYGFGVAVDASGSAYVAGQTQSSVFVTNPFPTTPGSFRPTGGFDAFVAKLSFDGSFLIYSTYLGGNTVEEARSVAVDPLGNAHVTGKTRSADFPLVNPLQPVIPSLGADNVFITTLNPAGSALTFSTYFGSGEGRRIAVDAAGAVYVTGRTFGLLPTANPLQPSHAGNGDAFIAKLGGAFTPPPPTPTPPPTPPTPTPTATPTPTPPPAPTPASPSALTAAAVSKSLINLSWADNSTNEGGFLVERCAGPSCANFAQVAQVGANVTFYADAGLSKNTAYRYRVRAFNANGRSGYSNVAETRTPNK